MNQRTQWDWHFALHHLNSMAFFFLILWLLWLLAKKGNNNNNKTPVQCSGSLHLMVFQWWCKSRLGCTAPTPSTLSVLVSFFPLNNPPPFRTDMAATRSRPSWGFWGGAQTRIIYKSCSAIETVVFLLSNAWNGNTCYSEHKMTLSDTLAFWFFCRFYTFVCACWCVSFKSLWVRVTLKLETFLNAVNLARLDGKQVPSRSPWNVWESLFCPRLVAKQCCFLISVNGQDIWACMLLEEMGSEQWL